VDVPGYGDARGDRWCGAEALDVAGDGRGGVQDGVLSCPDVDPIRNQIHHTQCGAGALADDIFRRTYAERIGADGVRVGLQRLAASLLFGLKSSSWSRLDHGSPATAASSSVDRPSPRASWGGSGQVVE
jgi:hypothetical protein